MTAVVFLPLAGAVLLFAVRGNRFVRLAALAVALADFALAVLVFLRFDADGRPEVPASRPVRVDIHRGVYGTIPVGGRRA